MKSLHASQSKLSKELENGIEILVGHVLIKNSRTAWPNKILNPFLSSLDHLLYDAYIIFQKKCW